ncbi:hypothetical protein Ocin01_10599 [Orchesella cincta]|uniref:Uncharacterized protein n=1 Tax=Orchesella cincta TaxID=48709 RepID=A0A1D2MSR4_ORCCI|nr:hypothetical protein Ocin01_10599 [Orchesella cincta]
MYPTPLESESAGLYYMIISLLPLAIYIDFFKPGDDLNDLEAKYLKKFAISELKLLIFCPSLMFAGLCAIHLFADPALISTYSSCFILLVLIPWSVLGHSSGILRILYKPPDCSIRLDVISSIIGVCYFLSTFALFWFICGVTGPATFRFLNDSSDHYKFPTQENPPPELTFVTFKDDTNVLVDVNRGYLTHALYNYASPTVFLVVMFYLSHFFLTVITRCIIVTVVSTVSHFVEG